MTASQKVLVGLLCLSLACANLNIPLKSQPVTQAQNGVDVTVDHVLYVSGSVSHLGSTTKLQNENLLIDIESPVNFVISSETKYGDAAVSSQAFNCNGLCDAGTVQADPVTVLGGKAILNGGLTLKAASSVQVEETTVSENIYVPATVDAETLSQNVEALKFANGALTLGRNKESLLNKLTTAQPKLVESQQFSLYLHDQISQINVGGVEEYFMVANSTHVRIPTNSKASWAVTVTDVTTKDGTVLPDSTPLIAHFDTTSEYIYVPHVDAAPNSNSTSQIYFMNVKELPCFQPNNNLENKLSFYCDAFPGYDSYGPITFKFQIGDNQMPFIATLQPQDYIRQNSDGKYELLFRFTSAPQTVTDLYLGTAFLKKYYTTFNADRGTVTLQERYQVNTPVNGAHISEGTQIPVIAVGSVIALASVAALLAILKKVKVEDDVQQHYSNVEMNSYANNTRGPTSYSQAPYSPVVNASYNPVVVNTVYNPQPVVSSVYNPVITSNQVVTNVANSQLRQSQNIIRQSQQVVRNSQNYVITQNF